MSLWQWKEVQEMLSLIFNLIQIVTGIIVGIIVLLAIYILLFRWDDYR
jgi:type II secretory pathway component PulF